MPIPTDTAPGGGPIPETRGTQRLAGKIAIITGGGAGIGAASAILFAHEGAKVVVADRDGERAAAVAAEIGAACGATLAVRADVTRLDDIQAVVARTLEVFGRPSILFNNAGVNVEQRRPLLEIPDEDFDTNIAVNLKAPFVMMKHVAPHMIAAGGGSIINTASLAAFSTVSTAGYSAAKAGLVAMTRVAAMELGRHNIRVNALCPGATMTPLAASQQEGLRAKGLPEIDALVRQVTVLKRAGTPEEMAKMALFLASDDSAYTTGQSFIVDGGWSLFSGIETRA